VYDVYFIAFLLGSVLDVLSELGVECVSNGSSLCAVNSIWGIDFPRIPCPAKPVPRMYCSVSDEW
jgi:hypothetical protein